MSKRGSKSAVKIDHGKSIIIGSRKGLSFKKSKSQKYVPSPPSPAEIIAMEKMNIVFLDTKELKTNVELILYEQQKISELVKLSKGRLKPRNKSFENKSREQLVQLITITQNKIVEILRKMY